MPRPAKVAIMMYSVKQVAEMLRVGIRVVTSFVDSGELDAVDVRSEEREEKEAPHPGRRVVASSWSGGG